MMWPTQSRERTVLFAGAAMIVAILFGARVMPSVVAGTTEARHNTRELVAEVARARLSLGDSARMMARLALARRNWAMITPAGVDALNATVASAAVGEMVSGAANDAGFRISTVALRTETMRGGVTLLSARVQGSSDVAALAELLFALEDGLPRLFVRSLSVQQTDLARGNRPQQLGVELVVEGFHIARGKVQ